jgi:hypothetical protein
MPHGTALPRDQLKLSPSSIPSSSSSSHNLFWEAQEPSWQCPMAQNSNKRASLMTRKLLDILQASSKLPHLPVVAITASLDPGAIAAISACLIPSFFWSRNSKPEFRKPSKAIRSAHDNWEIWAMGVASSSMSRRRNCDRDHHHFVKESHWTCGRRIPSETLECKSPLLSASLCNGLCVVLRSSVRKIWSGRKNNPKWVRVGESWGMFPEMESFSNGSSCSSS